MYKIYIYRKEDLNDATSFYVDIIISALKKNSIASEIVYAITNISKDDKVIVILQASEMEDREIIIPFKTE